MKKETYTLNAIKDLFDKYVLPTYEANAVTNSKVIKYIKGLCNKLNQPYQLSDGEMYIDVEVFKKLKEIMVNRWLFYSKKVDYYSTNEVAEILGCNLTHVTNLVNRNVLQIKTVINSFYFSKDEVIQIANFLNQTIGFKEIVEIVSKESNHPDIPPISIRSYIKSNLTFFDNPVDKYDIRIKKDEVSILIEKINEKYSPRESLDKSMIFKGEKLKYLNETSDLDSYLNIEFFSDVFPKEYKSRGFIRVARHVMMVCNNQNIDWYINKGKSNVYIKKEDKERYLQYYQLLDKIKTSDDYYSNSEVQKLLKIKDTLRVAEFVGAIKVENKYYMEKTKINEIIAINNNTILTQEATEILGIGEKTLFRALRVLGLEYISKGDFPLLRNSYRIYKSDIPKLKAFVDKEIRLSEVTHPYEKFKLIVEDIEVKTNLIKTIDGYDAFVIERLKGNDSDYIINALSTIYETIISTLNKEIMEHNDNEIWGLISSLETKISKREFSFFVDYCKGRYLTKYKKEYKVTLNEGSSEQKSYTFQQWVDFGGILFNTDGKFYEQLKRDALQKRGNAMSWLFCAIHYVCAWRTSDLILSLPIPSLEDILNLNEEEVIKAIENNAFTMEMARKMVISLVSKIDAFDPLPKKRSKDKSNPSLKFVVEESYIYQIGLLMALCEAHRRRVYSKAKEANMLEKKGQGYGDYSHLLTESASRKDTHLRFFGKIYNDIFGEDGFTNRRANSTFMGIIQTQSQKNGWNIGYQLASIIRSHKSDSRGTALSTQVYLEHLNKGKEIDQITTALTERGTFGFIPYLILKTIEGEKFNDLDMLEQNREIDELLPLKPYEIERIVKDSIVNRDRIKSRINELINKLSRSELIDVLKKILNGDAPSKMEHSHCFIKCFDKSACIYPAKTNCVGCDFHIPEMYFLIEFRSMFGEVLFELENTKFDFDKQRLSYAIKSIYLPILQEAMVILGDNKVKSFIDTKGIKDNIVKLHKNKKLLLR